MELFYDGQIRRYLTQFMRLMSNFSYANNQNVPIQVPVRYGDMSRQAASILTQNSENLMNSAPFIACYIKNLALSRERLQDPTFVNKLNIRERQWEYVDENPDSPTYGETIQDYGNTQGENYTVERLMPTPYTVEFVADIWSTNTEQKLQMLEQILVLFRPAMEIQTTSNYIDWTSLSFIELTNINWSNRTVGQGALGEIDIASLTFTCPIWITTPAKVKKLGIITKIITNIFTEPTGSIGTGEVTFANPNAQIVITPEKYSVLITDGTARLLKDGENTTVDTLDTIQIKQGYKIQWNRLLDLHPGKFRAGLSYAAFTRPDGKEVIAYLTINPFSEDEIELLNLTYDGETLLNSDLYDLEHNHVRGTVNAIVNPLTFNPGQALDADTRYLILEDINTDTNVPEELAPTAWKKFGQLSTSTERLVANANDIIQWNGTQWNVIFDSTVPQEVTYITNSYTGTQYKWDGTEWSKSVDGLYPPGQWRLVL
jgi:hypothetical protein